MNILNQKQLRSDFDLIASILEGLYNFSKISESFFDILLKSNFINLLLEIYLEINEKSPYLVCSILKILI